MSVFFYGLNIYFVYFLRRDIQILLNLQDVDTELFAGHTAKFPVEKLPPQLFLCLRLVTASR